MRHLFISYHWKTFRTLQVAIWIPSSRRPPNFPLSWRQCSGDAGLWRNWTALFHLGNASPLSSGVDTDQTSPFLLEKKSTSVYKTWRIFPRGELLQTWFNLNFHIEDRPTDRDRGGEEKKEEGEDGARVGGGEKYRDRISAAGWPDNQSHHPSISSLLPPNTDSHAVRCAKKLALHPLSPPLSIDTNLEKFHLFIWWIAESRVGSGKIPDGCVYV